MCLNVVLNPSYALKYLRLPALYVSLYIISLSGCPLSIHGRGQNIRRRRYIATPFRSLLLVLPNQTAWCVVCMFISVCLAPNRRRWIYKQLNVLWPQIKLIHALLRGASRINCFAQRWRIKTSRSVGLMGDVSAMIAIKYQRKRRFVAVITNTTSKIALFDTELLWSRFTQVSTCGMLSSIFICINKFQVSIALFCHSKIALIALKGFFPFFSPVYYFGNYSKIDSLVILPINANRFYIFLLQISFFSVSIALTLHVFFWWAKQLFSHTNIHYIIKKNNLLLLSASI